MLLSDDHLFFTASSEMRELISPLKKYNIHYFTYNKNYLDGTQIRLTTHEHHLKAFLENECYKTGNIDAHPSLYLDQVALFSTLKNQSLVEWIKNDFNVGNGIYVVRKSERYTEFFSFGTTPNNFGIIDFYLNNLNVLQKFCDYFKEQGKSLIARAEQHKLIHNYHREKTIQAPQFVENTDLELFTAQSYNLSPRLLEIAKLLTQGERAKEIAKKLKISHRTIEDHIVNLRIKFDAKNIMELVAKLTIYLNY
jgi:DNA-binding CsgD family transcriptional regulator